MLQAGEPLIPGSFSTCTTDSTNQPRAFAAMNPFRLLPSSHGTCVRYQRTVERLAARIGGINRAGQRLHVTPQTSSAQIGLLEERRGCQLSERDGRNIRLTDWSHRGWLCRSDLCARLAEGRRAAGIARKPRGTVFAVGIADSIPKSIACRPLEPAVVDGQAERVIIR